MAKEKGLSCVNNNFLSPERGLDLVVSRARLEAKLFFYSNRKGKGDSAQLEVPS